MLSFKMFDEKKAFPFIMKFTDNYRTIFEGLKHLEKKVTNPKSNLDVLNYKFH